MRACISPFIVLQEVTNNWYPSEILAAGSLYANDTAADDLYKNSIQALEEFNPIIIEDDGKIYRKQQFGPHLEIFFPDFRSYRDPNVDNSKDTLVAMMGDEQLEWLKQGLKESTATWKIISAHDPLGIVTGSAGDYDAFGNEEPAILGRELELQDLLSFIYTENIEGVLSLTTDVHFTAHVTMDPSRAEGNFTAFKPLDEFVVGPIHAGSFGPNFMDTSFGANYEYEMGPLTLGYERWANLPPSETRLQSFGHAAVAEDGTLTIKLIRITGGVVLEKTFSPPSSRSEPTSSSFTRQILSTLSPFVYSCFVLFF